MNYFLSIIMLLLSGLLHSQEYYMLVGTYDSPKSEGIYVFRFNTKDGTTREISHFKTSNPSFLTLSPNEKYVYAVNENADTNGKGGSVSSFRFNKKNGSLTLLNSQSSEGNHPCYITTDKTGKWLLAGNYSSGNFSVFPVRKGQIGKVKVVIQHEGSGPDSTRQRSPHVHGIFMRNDNKGFYVTDLGTDKIMNYSFDKSKGNVSPLSPPFFNIQPGSGPRHLAIHPSEFFLYLLNELSGTLNVINPDNRVLPVVQSITTLPASHTGNAGSADIHLSPDARFLYCTNRGKSNSIAIFSIDSTGKASPAGFTQTYGEKPRNFAIDPTGSYLLVANQESNEIVIFKRNKLTGQLEYTGKKIAVGKPVCIKWAGVN
jgi:6-phosphogluconolactonase